MTSTADESRMATQGESDARVAASALDDRAATASLFDGAGAVRALARVLDWATTALGPVSTWPATLRTAIRLMLDTPVATCLWVGPSYTLVYNDAYAPILGTKHPAALGRSGAEVWAELWPALEPQFAQVRAGGPAVFEDDALLRMERLAGGGAEDTWFTYSLSALTDDAVPGQPRVCLAVYNLAVEVTERARLAHERHRERTRLEAVFAQAPSFLAVLRGPDNVFELVNEAYEQ
ncbi:MAG TPA: hypothetical protein VE861_14865, partial [Gemmatimonadaceae bacterium]|nr:hypothetical protein [Gemmatimonadaceae bacterium]